MVVRSRRPRKLPPLELSRERRCYVAGLLDHGGILRTYARGNGRQIIRLTVANLSHRTVESLRADFGVGSRLGRVNAEGRGLTWSVEGRWACLRIGDAVIYHLEPGAPLQLALARLGAASPAWAWSEAPAWEKTYDITGTDTLPPLHDTAQLPVSRPGTTGTSPERPAPHDPTALPTRPASRP
jgi:hypothetical protein